MCWRKGTSVKANLAERGGVWEGSAVVSSIGTLFLELWVSGGGRGGGVERGSRGPSGRDRRQRQSCWAPLDPPGGVRLLLLHVHRAILSHAAVSPLIQPLAPPPPASFPLSRLPPAVLPPVWAVDPASVHRSVHQGEGRGSGSPPWQA